MTSLYCLLARDAETAVIFRRGPSLHTLLIQWDLTTHQFTPGQWFKGQIYVRKSDLSPDGRRLMYFAAKHRGPLPSWIAVSSPPFLTAHAIWPGSGTWNGISLFETNTRLAVACTVTGSEIAIPHPVQVEALQSQGHFFKLDNHLQLIRDGWTVSSGDPITKVGVDTGAVVYRKCLDRRGAIALCLSATDGHAVDYAVSYSPDMTVGLDADWADVRTSEVFYAQGGTLFRLQFARQGKSWGQGGCVALADSAS